MSTTVSTPPTINFKPAPSGNITIGGTPSGNFVGTSGGITIGAGGTTPNAASQPTYIQTPTGIQILNRPPMVNFAGTGGTTPNVPSAPGTPVLAHKTVPRMLTQVVGARPGAPVSQNIHYFIFYSKV
jgi:hypothetical protein